MTLGYTHTHTVYENVSTQKVNELEYFGQKPEHAETFFTFILYVFIIITIMGNQVARVTGKSIEWFGTSFKGQRGKTSKFAQ